MRKFLLFVLASIVLYSCGGSSEESSCQYSKVVSVTYNFNVSPTREVSRDTIEGCFIVTKNQNSATIADRNSDYEMKLIQGYPNSMTLVSNSRTNNWDETSGYKIANDMSGDTLMISYLPVEVTDPAVLKFGTVYKFIK